MPCRADLLLAFNASDEQKEMVKAFCKEVLEFDVKFSIGVFIENGWELCLTFFDNRHEIYFGIMSVDDKIIIPDATISSEELKKALKTLSVKYSLAMTRKPEPLSNKEFIMAWRNFIRGKRSVERISLL